MKKKKLKMKKKNLVELYFHYLCECMGVQTNIMRDTFNYEDDISKVSL